MCRADGGLLCWLHPGVITGGPCRWKDGPAHGGEAVPGPQDYNPAPPAKGPAFTISGKPASAAGGDAVPGPGEYSASAAAERGPAFTIGAKLPAGSAPAEAPGPADYPTKVHSYPDP